MCWCRIRMVLIGLLGLLCVVHVVSGMCGQTFTDPQSNALMAEVVLEGKVKLLSEPNKNKIFNATISVRKTIYKGEEALMLKGKSVKKLTIGKFQAKADPENCIGALRLGSTYIFFLKNADFSNGLYFELSALPVKKSKKRSRLLKKVLCPDCAHAPRIRKLTGQDGVDVGKRAMLKCSAKATPPPSFTWYRNGVLVRQRKGLMIKSGKRQSRLKIKKVGKEDVGVYTCEVTNAVGKDSKTFTLKVRSKTELLCETQTFCLNGGTCLYNPALEAQYCACAKRYIGNRCETEEPDPSKFPSDQASLIYERTLIIVGLVIAVIFLVAIFIASYILAKRRRKRFEAKQRRKEIRRAKEKERSQPYVTVDKYTPYRKEENVHQLKANQYGPPPGCDRLPYEHDNGFDFYKQQTQPLLNDHQPPSPDTTDRPGPESRRRLVASSVYDNTGEPATIWPSSVQGLTRAEVLGTPEAIEMDQLPSERPSKDIEEPNASQNPTHRQPLRSSPPLPQYDPSASQLPHMNGVANQQTAPILPVSQHEIMSSSDHPHYSHPVMQCSSNDSENSAETPVNSPSSSLWYDNPEANREECGDSSTKNDEISPISANTLESPKADNSKEADQQLSDDPGSVSPPSYQAAVNLTRQAMAMMLSTDTDSDDENGEKEVIQKAVNGMPEDLHISEEDLDLSRENLVSNSFNSLSTSSRQVSVDGDSQNTASVTPPEPWPPRIRKHQSDDIHNGHLWKNPLLPTESFRSQSLDTPGPVSIEDDGPRKKHHHNHLSSTVADSQDMYIQPNATGTCNHVDNSFDPSEDYPPWDADASREPEYMNIISEEEDRINRLKDVCPDQPAIPI